MRERILFDDFQPGTVMGQHVDVLDDALYQAWRDIFGLPPSAQPHAGALPSLALAWAMRAYLAVVTPRPPGNVHARQQFHMQALPEVGETIATTVSCVRKEIRRERRYVDIQVAATGRAQRALFSGEMSLIWAA